MLAAVTMSLGLALQATHPVPSPQLRAAAPAGLTVPGTPPALAWPSLGQAAVAVPASGLLLQSGPEAPVPIASLTKIMTAFLVLRDHPLAPGSQGPAVVMSAADQADSATDARTNATSVPVVAGQSFTERQLLDGLIVHSANDFADALARWDAGTVGAFVAKMNLEAAALGMQATHYVDPSGYDQAGTSTPGDQLRLSDAAMAIPAFAEVAAQPTITMPGAGLLANYVPAVGSNGVVGVKSGFTQAAMGCVVIAAQRFVDGQPVLVLAALTGQQGGVDPIRAADASALSLIDAVTRALRHQTVVGGSRQLGAINAPWAPAGIPVVTSSSLTALVWPGDRLRFAVHTGAVRPGLRVGSRVGTLSVGDGTAHYDVPLVATSGLVGPSLHWRFAHH